MMHPADGRRVVITGLGPVTPVGLGREPFWDAVCTGRSGTAPLAGLPGGFPVESLRSRVAARIPDTLLPADERAQSDRRSFLGELALHLALADAGLDRLDGDDAAVVLGNAIGASTAVEALFLRLDDGGWLDPERAPADLLRQLSFHTLSYEIALLAGCTGPVLTVSTGCTAGLDAVAAAFELIRSGMAEVALTGSAEAPLTPVVFAAFDVIGALSCRNQDAARASRPFDRDRDGFVLGEGAALLVLEERGRALARGAHIYCEVTGFDSVSNAFHMTQLPADGAALAACIRHALDDAGLPPDAIDHVNAHGSSTPQNDLCETNAVKSALGRRAGQITVNSLKSSLGHALGASNAMEVAACALALDRQHLFPTINLDVPGVGCDLDYVARIGRPAALRHLLKLSNGFSGIHSVLVLSHRDA